jgi:hypothetical protein
MKTKSNITGMTSAAMQIPDINAMKPIGDFLRSRRNWQNCAKATGARF